MKRDAAWLVILLTVPATSCRKQPDVPATTSAEPAAAEAAAPALPAALRIQLDSANAAFSAQDFPRALQLYRRVTEQQPDLSAGWFGVYMAQSKLGNQAAADSAIARAREAGNQ